MLEEGLNVTTLLVNHSHDAAERFANQGVELDVEHNPSEDAELLQHRGAVEHGTNNRFKVRDKALKYEQMSMSDRLVLPEENVTFENNEDDVQKKVLLEGNATFESEDDVQKNGSNIPMELVRQERSQRDALDDLALKNIKTDLALKNIKTVLLKLLNQTGLGKCAHELKTNK